MRVRNYCHIYFLTVSSDATTSMHPILVSSPQSHAQLPTLTPSQIRAAFSPPQFQPPEASHFFIDNPGIQIQSLHSIKPMNTKNHVEILHPKIFKLQNINHHYKEGIGLTSLQSAETLYLGTHNGTWHKFMSGKGRHGNVKGGRKRSAYKTPML